MIRKSDWQSWTRQQPLIPLTNQWEVNPLTHISLPRSPHALHKPSITLWNTWTSYGDNYTSDDLLAEGQAIINSHLPIQYLFADDGWCRIGDWDQPYTHKFPGGISALSSSIHRLNLKLGMWIAPFMVDPKSTLAIQHPDWLVKNKHSTLASGIKNNLLLRPFTPMRYYLDTKKPEVIDHIYQQIDKLISLGVDSLKLDFLYLPYFVPGLTTDAHAHQVLVDLFQHIRRHHPHIYILACGCPFAPAQNNVDAIRIGPDSTWPPTKAPQWLRRAVYQVRKKENTLKLLMHQQERKFYGLDPDVIMYPSEWNKAYSNWKNQQFDVLGLGYSLIKNTL